MPTQRGYMARLRTLWCQRHPEFADFTQQHLRDQAARLRRQGYDLLLLPPRSSGRRSSARSARRSAGGPQDRSPRQSDPPRWRVDLTEDWGTRTERITGKFSLQPGHLEAANDSLAAVIPEDADLLSLNWAVYHAAVGSGPRTRNNKAAFVAKARRRVAQLQNKINEARRQASRVQCVIDFITAGRAYTPKIRKISSELRSRHHTLNKAILLLVKERYVEKVRNLGVAKQSLERRLGRALDNAMFRSDPGRWFQPPAPAPDIAPTAAQVERFWGELYSEEGHFDGNTPALGRFVAFCRQFPNRRDDCLPVTRGEVEAAVRGMRNHAAPGPDGINIFWWKKFTCTHAHLARIFSSFIDETVPIPAWLTEGRTVLIFKKGDPSDPKNYRPITCLNALCKIFTRILHERVLREVEPAWREIYEQRGSKRGLGGCKDNLLVDRCITQDAIQHKRNLSVAWIDYRKAFDTISHKLIIHVLERLAVSPRIVGCIRQLMPLWKTRFTVSTAEGTVSTGAVGYRRGIIQGDSLSPLLFCISLLPLSVALRAARGYEVGPPGERGHGITHLFYMDDLKLYGPGEGGLRLLLNIVTTYTRAVGMDFGLDKCAVLHLRRGRAEGIAADVRLVDGSVFKHLDAGGSYCYLGIDQRSVQDAESVKGALRSEYRRRLRRIWKSDLSGKNKIAATNMLAVPVLLYSFGVVKWRRDELKQLDIGTRKIMNIQRSLHPRSSVPRLYMLRQSGGRGLLGLECLHDRMVLGIASDAITSTDPLLEIVHQHELHGVGSFLYKAADYAAEALGLEFRRRRGGALPTESVARLPRSRRRRIIRAAEQAILTRQHAGRPMHGVFFRHVEEQGLSAQLTFSFLRSAGLMSETEGFICACQDGVINTLVYRSRVLGQPLPTLMCRACKQAPETLMHILSACPVYAVSGYIYRHNAALRVLYYHLRHSYGIDQEPVPPYLPGDVESVVVGERCKIYWNFSFATIGSLQASKPDVVLFDFDDKTIYVIEFSAPAEANVSRKEEEKRLKYQPLLAELRRLHRGYKVILVVLIIGALGGMKESFVSGLASIPVCRPSVRFLAGQMQKAVILGSLRILRQHDCGLR